jgi:hypothetical protein
VAVNGRRREWNQVREARRLREQQSRPFVVIDFDIERGVVETYLEVANLGNSLARDVTFEITPPLASAACSAFGARKTNAADSVLLAPPPAETSAFPSPSLPRRAVVLFFFFCSFFVFSSSFLTVL